MQPKRGYLLFLLSFAVVFLYYHSSLHLFQARTALSTPTANPRNPNPSPRSFSFAVKVLTFDRPASLSRCLRSLAAADYGGDRADLHVFVDHFPATNDSNLVSRKLEEARRVLDLVDGFDWAHGEKLVHYRTANAGLQAQWLEAWWPSSDDEFAFVVEDDLEVSPLYYRFLKALILKYYYDRSNYSPYVYGASLQRPRFVAGKHGNKLQLDSETRLFLYQMVGTWGQLLFPKPWKEFRLWFDVHKAKGIKPILQGMVTTGWYKKMGERIWTPWFIKFIHSRGYYNIYTNFQHERALSVSHRDAGVNYGKTAGPDSKLLDESSLDFNLWEMPPTGNLRWYDFCFRQVFPRRIVSDADELGPVLGSWQKQNTIVLISLYRVTQRMARNLICHLERIGFQNFILLGDDSELMIELAWKGNLVIDASQLMYSIRSGRSLGGQHSEVKLAEIWVKAYVSKKCLELGYNLWLLGGNIIPISASLPELPDSSYDFFTAKDVELMYVKSSPSSLKIWNDDFNSKVVNAGKSLIGSNSGFREHMNFVYVVKKSIEDMGGVKLWELDELAIGVKVGTGGRNHSSLGGGKKMVFCPEELMSDSVQRDLQNLGLWLIDEEDSCVAVVCRQ